MCNAGQDNDDCRKAGERNVGAEQHLPATNANRVEVGEIDIKVAFCCTKFSNCCRRQSRCKHQPNGIEMIERKISNINPLAWKTSIQAHIAARAHSTNGTVLETHVILRTIRVAKARDVNVASAQNGTTLVQLILNPKGIAIWSYAYIVLI
jgi:hypothetical protein